MANTKKYTYIDSMRGYAMLMVLSTHIYAFVCHRDKQMQLANFLVQCRMGVMLFFMMSALTLFLSLDRKASQEKAAIRNFFIRRFFRIAPLFYLMLIGNVIFKQFDLVSILSTITFTNGFIPNAMEVVGGGWTLAVEMLFYALIPILFKCVKNLNAAIVLFVATVLFSIVAKFIVLRYFGNHYSHETMTGYIYHWLPGQLPVFSLGIILYFLLFKAGFNIDSETLFKKPLGYLLIFLSLYFVLTLSYSSKLFINENIAFSFALMLFILGMAINPESFFNNKAMQFFGKISYSFYLIHGLMIEQFVAFSDKTAIHGNKLFIIALVILLIVTSAIAYITYLLIEQPFQKLGSKLIERLESRKAI